MIGLGNPGKQYEHTRHNFGFELIDFLANKWGIPVKNKNPLFLFGSGEYQNIPILLAKPLTFMNRSGTAVSRLLREPEVELNQMLIIVDDLNIPLGKIRIRPKGSHGGHNGLRSIFHETGTNEIHRLRLGIGGTDNGWVDYVLEPFSKQEQPAVEETIDNAAKAIEVLLLEGIEKAMNSCNR